MNRKPTEYSTRRRLNRSLTLALLAGLTTLACGTQAALAAPSVWIERSTTKVRPNATPTGVSAADIHAARNEFEAFQIVVQAPEGIGGITATASALSGPGGASVPASAVRLYRVDLMQLGQPSDGAGGTGLWPDPLIPAVDDLDGSGRGAFPFDAAAGQARALWVEVLVPADAPAGQYHGTVQVSSSAGALATVPVTLEVFGFALPSTPTMRSYYQLNDMAVCRGHHAGDASCGSDAAKIDLLDRYARFALDHRLTLGNVFYVRPSGGDWSRFDGQYGPLLDGGAATRLAGARFTSAKYMMPLEAASLASFQSHMSQKGWLDRAFDYTADEPGYGSSWSEIGPRSQLVHANAPGLKTLVTTTVDQATDQGLASAIDIFTPVVNYIDGQSGMPFAGDQSTKYDAARAGGASVWLYQSCMSHGCGGSGAVGTTGEGYPSVMIDHSSTRNRAMHWVTFRYGATGDLYWETAYEFNRDPWSSVYAFTGNGDGTLFYPGTPGRVGGAGQTPVASQRLKHLRDSVEDYEYLALVARLGDPAFAAQQARAVAPTAYSVGNDPSRMEAARLALARRIVELTGAGAAPTPATPASPESPTTTPEAPTAPENPATPSPEAPEGTPTPGATQGSGTGTGIKRPDRFMVNPAAGQIQLPPEPTGQNPAPAQPSTGEPAGNSGSTDGGSDTGSSTGHGTGSGSGGTGAVGSGVGSAGSGDGQNGATGDSQGDGSSGSGGGCALVSPHRRGADFAEGLLATVLLLGVALLRRRSRSAPPWEG